MKPNIKDKPNQSEPNKTKQNHLIHKLNLPDITTQNKMK